MKRVILSLFVFFSGWAYCSLSYAASLQMYPSTIKFCGAEKARPVFIRNTGEQSVSAQIRLYEWRQQDGKDVLTPAQDAISSPPIASVPPGKEQLVRVMMPGGGSTGKSYRLIVDELPEEHDRTNNAKINFLLRYSVPVLQACKEHQYDATKLFAVIDKKDNRPYLRIKNEGDVSIKLSNVYILSAGKKKELRKGLMGYVLPGSEMSWALPKNLNTGSALFANINDESKSTQISIFK